MTYSLDKKEPARETKTEMPVKRAIVRLASLDAYRGFTMLLLAANGFGLVTVAKKFPDDPTWQYVKYLFSHVKWGFYPSTDMTWMEKLMDVAHWITAWDMIQPSFMFMVGVSLPFSYGKRKALGNSYLRMFGHAAVRAVILVLLGVWLRSFNHASTNWFFMDVVAQIGLGYLFLFLLWNRGFKIQMAAFCLILVGYWAFFAMSPLPDKETDLAAVGVIEGAPDYELQYTGFEAHWNKNTNIAHTFDLWFMNLFPQNQKGKGYVTVGKGKDSAGKEYDIREYKYNSGGYQVLNFIPSIATMLLGMMAGTLLYTHAIGKDNSTGMQIATKLFIAGVVCILLGKGLELAGVCPIVKIIWTPSWTLFSGGICLLILTSLYMVIDVIGLKFWAFPAIVVGMNSIAIYVMHNNNVLGKPIQNFLSTHGSKDIFTLYGYVSDVYVPIVQASLGLLVLWIILFWMYRQRFFVRV